MPTDVESPRWATAVQRGAVGAVVVELDVVVVSSTVVSVAGTSDVVGAGGRIDVVDASVDASVEPAAHPASDSTPSAMVRRRAGRCMDADDPTLDAEDHAYGGRERVVPKIR
jgi:hypothetical protein